MGWNGLVMRSIENSESNPLSLPVQERKKSNWKSSLNISDDQEEQRDSESMTSSNILPKDIMDEILLRLPTINKPPLLFITLGYALCPPYQLRLDEDGGDLQQQLQHHEQQQQQQQQQRQQQQRQQQREKITLRQIWGPCSGGLLCIELRRTRKYDGKDSICLWNPCTKEFKELPDQPKILPEGLDSSLECLTYGFGYDNTVHDYKVIRKTGFYDYSYDRQFLHTLVEVYTLGSDSWKVIGNYQYQIPEDHTGVYINGRGIYWLARKQSIDMIICFDIANEDYKEISSPPSVLIKIVDHPWCCSRDLPPGYVKLTELKGFLCIINPIIEQKCLEVWAMNKEEEEDESNWSKLFTIREPINAFPCQILSSIDLLGNYKNNSDEILMLMDRKELLLYNPKNDKTRALIQLADDKTFKEVQTCTESLVSLDWGTYF